MQAQVTGDDLVRSDRALVVFLGINGRRLILTNDEAYHLVIEVAAGELPEVAVLAEKIKASSEPR